MDSERWRKIEAIFRGAASLSAHDRPRYIDEVCAGDPGLKAEVESLLQADARSGSPLDGSAMDALGTNDLISQIKNHAVSPPINKGESMSQRCEKGHFFDPTRHVSCPHCGVPGLTVEPEQTRPAAYPPPIENTRPATALTDDKTQARKVVEEGATVGVFKAKIGIEPVVGWLVCVQGPDRGRDYRIRSQRNFIGRDARMDISISSDDQISRENHAAITYDPRSNHFRLAPGDSHGITYLNNAAVDVPVVLRAYDVIELGVTKLIFVPFCGEAFEWQ